MSSTADRARWEPARPAVHSIAIELTAFCNQRCSYCYNPWRADGGAKIGAPDTATLLARIDRVLDAVRVDHVTLTGGEPLAAATLFAVLDLLRARHVRAQIISNGGLVTEAIAARLARYRPLAVLVTLNGPDAAAHEGATAGRGDFDATIRGIRALRRERVPVEGSIVLTARNAALVAPTLELFASLGVRKIALSRFSPAGFGAALAHELLPSPADITLALERAAAFARAAAPAIALFATMPIPPCVVDKARFPEIAFHDCPIGTREQEYALGPRGELRHCALHAAPLPGAGDVADPVLDVARLLAAGDPHGYRAELPDACAGCRHAEECGGGCGAAALWVFGSRREQDPFVRGLSPKRLPVVP